MPVGCCPVGIGEAADRCFEKVMGIITGDEVVEACGSDQMCSGVKGGIKGAVQAISETFQGHCDQGWGLF